MARRSSASDLCFDGWVISACVLEQDTLPYLILFTHASSWVPLRWLLSWLIWGSHQKCLTRIFSDSVSGSVELSPTHVYWSVWAARVSCLYKPSFQINSDQEECLGATDLTTCGVFFQELKMGWLYYDWWNGGMISEWLMWTRVQGIIIVSSLGHPIKTLLPGTFYYPIIIIPLLQLASRSYSIKELQNLFVQKTKWKYIAFKVFVPIRLPYTYIQKGMWLDAGIVLITSIQWH